MQTHSLEQTVDAIKKHKKFLLSAHVDPEGDCVASLLGLDSLLQKIKKPSVILCDDPIPPGLNFLDNGRWTQLKGRHPYQDYDAAIIADCPNLDRIGKVKDLNVLSKLFVINIDHHVSNMGFGNINFVNVKAAATGELIYDLYKAFDVPLSIDDCKQIYVSISTDTGSFRYSNTTARTHEIISDLMRLGLDIEKLNEDLYENVPRRKMELFKIFLNRIEFEMDGKVASAAIYQEDLIKTHTDKTDLEGFVEYLRSMQGVEVAFLLGEKQGDTRISFRSKGSFDVNKLASSFGGGGHKKAAGCTIHAPVSEARKLILNQIATAKI